MKYSGFIKHEKIKITQYLKQKNADNFEMLML